MSEEGGSVARPVRLVSSRLRGKANIAGHLGSRARGSWTFVLDPTARTFLTSSGAMTYFEDTFGNVALADFNMEEVFDSLSLLGSFPGKDRESLVISIGRLRSSYLRGYSADAAIDLGVAAEVILLHGLSDTDRGELTHRMAIRAGRYTGVDLKSRQDASNRFKKAYALRSKAAHTGPFEANEKTKHQMDSGITLVNALIRKVLADQKFPDWEHVLFGD
jgi:Apea-like HEPN